MVARRATLAAMQNVKSMERSGKQGLQKASADSQKTQKATITEKRRRKSGESQKGASMDAERAIGLLGNIASYDIDRSERGAEKREAIKEAIAALEKRTPKAPIPYKGLEGECRSCGVVFLDRSTNYCGYCGQRLDWDGTKQD